LVDKVRSIGDQAAGSHKEPFEVDCGEFVPGRQRDDQIAMKLGQRAASHDQATIRGAREGPDSTLDLARVAYVDRAYLQPDRRGHRLDRAELASPRGDGGITQDRGACQARCDLLEQL
jgi:hypothetical protein